MDIFARFGSQTGADRLGDSFKRGAEGCKKEWNINGEPAAPGVVKV